MVSASPPKKQEGEPREQGVTRSLDGDKLGSLGGSVTDLSVTNWLVGHGVLSEVVSNHVSFDFNWVPILSRVDFADGGDHLWHDDAVAEVGLDWLGLLAVWLFLHGLDELLDQSVVTSLVVSSISHSSALSGSEHGNHFLSSHGKQLVKFNSSVNLLSECFFLGGALGHGRSEPLFNGTHI